VSDQNSLGTHLAFDQFLTAIGSAAKRFHDHADQAGLEAAVPSCPEWDVAALLSHQGMVHRWAAANLRGDSDHRTEDSETAAAAAPSLLDWFDEGAQALLETLSKAPADLEAMVFLSNAPPPRLFWARRQAHETTIHAVDAQAAVLQRLPRPDETMINEDLAVDGIDELLMRSSYMGQGTLTEMATLVSFQNGRRRVLQDFGTVVEDGCASGFQGSAPKASVLYAPAFAPGLMPKLIQENYVASCRNTKRWKFVSTGMMQQ